MKNILLTICALNLMACGSGGGSSANGKTSLDDLFDQNGSLTGVLADKLTANNWCNSYFSDQVSREVINKLTFLKTGVAQNQEFARTTSGEAGEFLKDGDKGLWRVVNESELRLRVTNSANSTAEMTVLPQFELNQGKKCLVLQVKKLVIDGEIIPPEPGQQSEKMCECK